MPLSSTLKSPILRITNEEITRITREAIQGVGISVNDILILTTGSNGRGERYGELGEFELMIYILNQQLDFYTILNSFIENSGNLEIFIEPKNIDKVTYFEGDFKNGGLLENPIFFPSRHIDSKYIYGSIDKYKLVQESFIRNIENTGRSEMEDWRRRIANHKKISHTGEIKWKGQISKLFNDEEKSISYSNDPLGKQISLKLGPLRYIQYKIVLIVMKLIRIGKVNTSNINSIGRSIPQKLDFISQFGIFLNHNQLSHLKQLYEYFLELQAGMMTLSSGKGEFKAVLDYNHYQDFKQNIEEFNLLCHNLDIK